MASERPILMTPKARIAYAQQLTTPKAFNGGKAKYGCTLLFDAAARNTPEYKALQASVVEAIHDKWGDKAKQMTLRNPFLDGDLPQYSKNNGFPGCTFLRVSTEFKPQFVDKASKEVPFDLVDEMFYSGAYARASVNVYPYDSQGNRGVSIGLRNMQWLGNGEKLWGSSASDEFKPVEDDGADLDSFFSGKE